MQEAYSKILEVINNYNLSEAYTTFITIITTVASLLIANVCFEKFKQKQERVKTAKIIIAFAKNKLKKIPKNMNIFVSDLSSFDTRKESLLSKKDIPKLKTFLAIIQIDPITLSSLADIGIFKNRDIEKVINYVEYLDYWKNRFSRFVNELNELKDNHQKQAGNILKIDIRIFSINSYMLILALSKIANLKKSDFNIYKDALKEELSLIEEEFISELDNLQYWVDYYNYSEHKAFYKKLIRDNKLKINELLIRVKELFKELGLSHELPRNFDSLTTMTTDLR